MRKFLILFLIAAIPVLAQTDDELLLKKKKKMGGASAPVSNIVLIQSVTCTNGASGNYNCTLASTGTGNLILVQEFDYAGSPAAPSIPTDGGDTFVQDCTNPSSPTVGRATYFSFPNSVSGRTTFTIRPASGASSAVVEEWSGMATASPLDVCVSDLKNLTGTSWGAFQLGAAQTDLAIGAGYNRVNNTDVWTAGGEWTIMPACDNGASKFCGDTTDGDGATVQYIINGKKSGFTTYGTINNSRTILGSMALYKSAVAGTPPAGNLVTGYCGFENSSNGTAITAAILAGGCKGIAAPTANGTNLGWSSTASFAGMTVATAAQQNDISQNTTNGTTYAAASGTRGVAYTPSSGPTVALLTFPNTTGHASAMVQFTMPPGGDNTLYSALTINGTGGADFCDAQTQTSTSIALETKGATSSSITGLTNGASYFLSLTYDGTTSPDTCTLKVYDSSGSQVGSTLTQTSTGNNAIVASSASFGQSHAATGPGGTTLNYDNFKVNATDGTGIVP